MFFALELGLAWSLVFFRVRALAGPHSPWTGAYRFWVRVFALAYIIGFAASVPVFVQLGSMWPELLAKTSTVASPLLATAVGCALVFKASFGGAMLYGARSWPQWLHAIVVGLLAIGSTLTAACLMTLFAWMLNPVGTTFVDSFAQVESWHAIFLQPFNLWLLVQALALSLFTAGFFQWAGFLDYAFWRLRYAQRAAIVGHDGFATRGGARGATTLGHPFGDFSFSRHGVIEPVDVEQCRMVNMASTSSAL